MTEESQITHHNATNLHRESNFHTQQQSPHQGGLSKHLNREKGNPLGSQREDTIRKLLVLDISRSRTPFCHRDHNFPFAYQFEMNEIGSY